MPRAAAKLPLSTLTLAPLFKVRFVMLIAPVSRFIEVPEATVSALVSVTPAGLLQVNEPEPESVIAGNDVPVTCAVVPLKT